jgi:CelD/BcsL family acetyltransferase involved in cellulose biosynthesis
MRSLLQATPALRHDTIALEKMPETIGAQANPLLSLDVRLNPSGAYETVLGADWEQFYSAKRSSATRRRDRTKLKRLGELGEVKFVNPDASAELALTLDALVRQKGKSFARMGVPNIFERPGHAAFFQELATAPRMRSLVHLSRLDVGQTWAAVNLGLTFRGCYYHILASYDDGEVSRFGPGAAHLRELLRFAIARGCKRFDFTIGDEPYKRDWCDTEQHLHDHSAAVTLRGWPSAFASEAWRRIKRTIKKTAPLWNAVQRVRSTIAALRKKPAPAANEPTE